MTSRFARMRLLMPGLLIAATGVGAGDLLTASLAGSNLGVSILWAAWMGGLLKWFLNEGIAVMFVAVIVTTWWMSPDWSAVLSGLLIPVFDVQSPAATGWILGVLGGVGGTVTLLSYGYWIREQNRRGRSGWRLSRIDLTIGYSMTVVFGICMIIIGSQVELTRGPLLALDLASKISDTVGPGGDVVHWIFLFGFWGAVFSSLLGGQNFPQPVHYQYVPDPHPALFRIRGTAAVAEPYPGLIWRSRTHEPC